MTEEQSSDLVYVSEVLEYMRQERERGEWPICHYLSDPSGKTLVQTYVQQQQDSTQHILYIEIPPPHEQKRTETYLPTLFLKGFGDEFAARREDAEAKRMLLELLLVQRDIDLIVLVDAHHLVTPAKQLPLTYEITWIKALIKDLYPPIPFMMTGSLELVEKIIASNEQMRSLFSRLLLPSEQINATSQE